MQAKSRAEILYAPPERFGAGHFVRCQALYKELLRRGVEAKIRAMASDGKWTAEAERIHSSQADAIIVDWPERLPKLVRATLQETGAAICLLNGVGHEPWEVEADLIVIQGIVDSPLPRHFVSGPKYVILRREVTEIKPVNLGFPIVYGGSQDKMNLRERVFAARTLPSSTIYLRNESAQVSNHTWLSAATRGEEFIPWLASCSSAILAMGMTVWEAIALGKPCHVFSVSSLHLEFAQAIARAGGCLAWDGVGVPSWEELRGFLNKKAPIPPSDLRPDGEGAQRVADLVLKLI